MKIRVGRFTAGVLAGVIATIVTVFSVKLSMRLNARLALQLWGRWPEVLAFFLSITAGVFWLGERYGLIADPYRSDKDDPLSLK